MQLHMSFWHLWSPQCRAMQHTLSNIEVLPLRALQCWANELAQGGKSLYTLLVQRTKCCHSAVLIMVSRLVMYVNMLLHSQRKH